MIIKVTNLDTNKFEIIDDVISFDNNFIVKKSGYGKIYSTVAKNTKIEEYNEQVD